MSLRSLRARARQLPDMRAATRQWPRWVMRQLVMPIVRLPLTLTSRTGVRCRVDDDPVDDLVFKHVHGRGGSLYFPPVAIEDGGLILDVGAHHGIYAAEALRRYPASTLIAVEPDPIACRKIEANAALNDLTPRIEIVCAGLASSSGTGWLDVSGDGSWGNRTHAGQSRPDVGDAARKVELRTLDAILRGRRPSIVKCNAEGAEFALVPQLLALGLAPRLIVLMIHPEAGNPRELLDGLRAAGYRVDDADDPPKHHRFHCVLATETTPGSRANRA
jgi:FkbM family methyltransferase